MSIRLKLLFSYTGTLLITILIFVATTFFITVAVTGDMKSIKQFYKIHYALNPLSPEVESLFMELKYMTKNDNPDRLLDAGLLKDYDNKLRIAQATLIIRKGQGIYYASPPWKTLQPEAHLPEYDAGNIQIRGTFNIGDRFFSYAKYDFVFGDQSSGSVFVLRERSPFAELTRKLLPLLISILFILLLLANVMLYYFITRSIIVPLQKLRLSADKIREGNLDFRIEPAAGGEIGQLSTAFEEMRKQLNHSLELQQQYEENRKELLSNISHDLKTPISSIKGYIEGIRDGVANTPEKMDKYVNTIFGKTVAMDRLIDELFLYSKLDLKKVPFHFEKLDLNRFLSDVLEEQRFDLEAKGFQLHYTEWGGEPVYVHIDPEKLERAVTNIIDNSVKFMDKEEKHITVRAEPGKKDVTVRITDNGPGIPGDAAAHIFDRFYRAESSRNSKTGGSGLGLAIARQVIEGHGGTIGAESVYGQGTTIYFTLERYTSNGNGDSHEKNINY
ncbi:sensor histidine kinase [Paenibacillus allorhizosphaerae]|uniref:histidine kinase n=1 Tax=Paenibacillus allorhizosphaerae TaxID=2849866 RepID=A0ABM8VI18_9BACL|nr:HAMP domain-containing sensor histidine kinase [Paenibacillus allorhizosphaerae]CAG7643384.1 Adaptive-response sensory-kinase SasA [Paenibacillus allorhizosphaerae]